MLGLSPIGDTPLGNVFYLAERKGSLLLSADIRLDGGDDYYHPAWRRVMGLANAAADAEMAEERYLTYYLVAPDPGTRATTRPSILTDPVPCCSVTQDGNENVFYSIRLGNEVFNFLTNGDLSVLFPEDADEDWAYYPVGII